MAVFLDEDGYVDQRVCRFYLVGNCLSGNSCNFLHCKELLKTKMTWVCLHFLSSSGCSYGANCKFDHPSWACGLYLLPKICGQYRHEKDGEKCADQDCRNLHFTDAEHQAYIKDKIIPERYARRPKRNDKWTSNSGNDDDEPKYDSKSVDDSGNLNRSFDSRRDRNRSPKPVRNKSPKRFRSRSPEPKFSRTNKEGSSESEEKRMQKMKRILKELRTELDDVWKENKQLQRELVDHKRFHDSDQELINDLMQAREKLEDDVNRLNTEKLEMTKQISDLFSDNKVVVEENQRLRGLLQRSQDTQPRVQAAPQSVVTPMAPAAFPESFTISNNQPPVYQTNWN